MSPAHNLLPIVTPDSAPFWNSCRNGRMLLQRCTACEAWRYPPGPVCSRCGSLEFSWTAVSGRGTILSFVVYHRAFHTSYTDEIPYAVALVELAEGVRMVLRVGECPVDGVEIDRKGEIQFRKVTEEIWIPVFVPIAEIPPRTALPPLIKGE